MSTTCGRLQHLPFLVHSALFRSHTIRFSVTIITLFGDLPQLSLLLMRHIPSEGTAGLAKEALVYLLDALEVLDRANLQMEIYEIRVATKDR